MGRNDREVIVVEQDGGGGLKWLLLGAAVGAGLALLFSPRSGKEIRRELGRGIRGLRDLADDTIEQLQGDAGDDEEGNLRSMADAAAYDEDEEEPAEAPRPVRNRPSQVSAREELERRLAAARARRRQPAPADEEEPVA